MIAFTQQGSGPALILIHGFCESKEMWKTFSEDLSANYTVYCPDLPGFGESPLIEPHISMEEAAVLLQDWMEENNITKPIVIGHSLGGYVTLALAELMWDGLKAIGLFHSTAFPDDEEKKQTRNKTIEFIKKHGVDKFVESFVPPLFSDQHRAEQADQIAGLIQFGKKSSQNGMIAFTAAMRDRKDRFELWKTFPLPKLMIAGELDPAVKIEASRKHQPYATHYYELIGTGHMGMFEEPEKTLGMVIKFLKHVAK
ncbi:alpha/beta fold hydrolase [Cecembia calidifontis]|jgi:pimeloyl-ACP methyl ester carboxylesterase|uniref:Pimeloyl-ACP methyl ester carboxylesterase n=1 Tax=Cecembia calidifontis TaxID=1187080 RepID=A0A4Q7P6H4_9BACT|nr:alpha/beta hydrolase [Cecembia calidifontis]RZS95575.1 pimeloyl-ACP methyl ester carboxylesterase [Cecembia calidifontis]